MLALAGSIAACSHRTNSNPSAVDELHSAINALLNAPNYTVTITTTSAGPSLPTDTVVIQNPNRIAINDSEIDIGSTAYSKGGPGGAWFSHQHAAVATNFMNTSLFLIHMLNRATAVRRAGNVYVVPPAEAAGLVQSTHIIWGQLQEATGVTLSATVESGFLKSLTLKTAMPSMTITNVVSRVGTSPPVNAPPHPQGGLGDA